jgi:hypothetical protein
MVKGGHAMHGLNAEENVCDVYKSLVHITPDCLPAPFHPESSRALTLAEHLFG